jgi:hypothetical protein
MRVIIIYASAKPIFEILVVSIIFGRLFRVHISLFTCLFINTKCAWRGGWKPCGAAVAYKVALVEKLDEGVLAVAGYGA